MLGATLCLPLLPLRLPAADALLITLSPSSPFSSRSFSSMARKSAFSSTFCSSRFLAPLRSRSLASRSAFNRRSSSLRRWIHFCSLGWRGPAAGYGCPGGWFWSCSTTEADCARRRVCAMLARFVDVGEPLREGERLTMTSFPDCVVVVMARRVWTSVRRFLFSVRSFVTSVELTSTSPPRTVLGRPMDMDCLCAWTTLSS